MPPKPHSQTVRGTLDNPRTKEAMKPSKPTSKLGDATSLKPENDDKALPPNDSAPPSSQSSNSDANSKPDAITIRRSETVKEDRGKDLPHSKKIRGTLANSDGKKANKTQLGDPASLKAETSKSEMKSEVEREGGDKSGKSKL